ncbi:MAG: fumarylacetoacetate hydrolase family protein [Pseudomonadales bacterium]|nr:fumarylacetoacetate hydrolase family protein [Pseudomonadales bacterium]
MRISVVTDDNNEAHALVSEDGIKWFRCKDLSTSIPLNSALDIMLFEKSHPGKLSDMIAALEGTILPVDYHKFKPQLPFKPLAYRDFMLFEQHYINVAKNMVARQSQFAASLLNVYEKLAGKPFRKLKPSKRWYEHPIYYLGNHLNFVSDGDTVSIPAYSQELDYELEIGIIICKPLKNATVDEAEQAIGGFVVFNDFSARDVQMDEMDTGFGPMKAKNFINAISNVVVTADEILPMVNSLTVTVTINGKKIARNTSAGMHFSIPQAIAYASWEEQLHAGEFFGSGTIPHCTGMENGVFLHSNDSISLEIEGIGSLYNKVE